MLTGEMAFTGSTAQAVIASRFTHTPPSVTDSRPAVPAAIAAAVARLLERAPAERYPSGAQVVAALRSRDTAVAAPAPRDRSLVVLPFANLSADPDNEYFSDGLTEELITDLAGVKALRVISRGSSQQLKGTDKGMREIGRALGVRYVLTGSARKAGTALRITAQLTDTTTDEQVWADKYSGTMGDVFDVQERVSRAIVSALQITLSASEDTRLAARPIKDPRAFELYLRAQALVRRYGSSVDQVDALIDRAIAIEGPSLPLRALRGHLWVSQIRAGMSTAAEHLERAESEARSLIELAPDAAYGYSLLGFISYERGLMADTVRYLGQALEHDPSDADALFFRGIALTAAGQGEAAIAAGRSFLAADPLSPMAGVLHSSTHWFVGRPSEGLAEHEHCLVLDPENPIIHWSLGYTYALLGRLAEARERAAWMQARVPTMPYSVQLVSLVDALEGRREQARAMLARVAGMTFDGHITFHLSESYAMAGDTAAGLLALEQAIERGFYPSEYFAVHCPFMAPLRGSPEFARLVERASARVAEFALAEAPGGR
jgi:TolB-like protein/Flp pilus assembly protein TadD